MDPSQTLCSVCIPHSWRNIRLTGNYHIFNKNLTRDREETCKDLTCQHPGFNAAAREITNIQWESRKCAVWTLSINDRALVHAAIQLHSLYTPAQLPVSVNNKKKKEEATRQTVSKSVLTGPPARCLSPATMNRPTQPHQQTNWVRVCIPLWTNVMPTKIKLCRVKITTQSSRL